MFITIIYTMKRLLTIVQMLVLTMIASAQGAWTVSYRQADELIGQDARNVYIYDVDGIGSIVVWDWKKPNFRLITEKGFFHKKMVQGVNELCVPVMVGFYDKNGTLKTKLNLIMFEEDNHGGKFIATGGFYLGGRGNIRKIMSQMKSGDGYVRFVAELYNKPNFDIKVTPYQKR